MKRLARAVAILLAVGFAGAAHAEVPEVRIARQFSMGYLQLNLLDHEKLIQKHAAALGIPEVKVTTFKFNGPAAMNDALLSDSVDIVSGSPQGLLTIWSRTRGSAQEVRAISALATLPFTLNTNDATIKTIDDMARCKKIAVPAVRVSAQAVTLEAAAARAYGEAAFARFDPQTVSMSPPDATIALLSAGSEVNCVWAVPPYLQQQLQNPAVHAVLNSFDVWGGPNTFTMAYTASRFRNRNPTLFKALYDALTEATERVNADLGKAARYWIEDGESKLPVDFVRGVAAAPGTTWTTVPQHTMQVADFMHRIGAIKVMPQSWQDYMFPEAQGLPGS
jgi:NitT/TauT family transport system substrate-binding protein